ncbi:MAG: hypothetical protein PVF05_01690 [Gemmatimonadales bacterium]
MSWKQTKKPRPDGEAALARWARQHDVPDTSRPKLRSELAATSLGESDVIDLAVYEAARVWLEANRVAAGVRACVSRTRARRRTACRA